MTGADLRSRLRACLPSAAVRERESMALHTTFQVGGPAEWFVEIRSVDELQAVAAVARETAMRLTVVGGGSNLVVSDAGVEGIVARLRLTGISMAEPHLVRAEAGVTINGLVRWLIGRSLVGLEAWAGTPGTVGGAIYGNAHYAGRNIGDQVRSVGVVTVSGDLTVVDAAEMEFAYDRSRLQRTGEILVWADFGVRAGDAARARDVARASLAHRKGTQPLAQPSAGCIFQNPDPNRDRLPPGVPASAGALIDRAGLKGHRIGGASISSVHANFFVNDGTATARDIWQLAEAARAEVRDRFGVELRTEVVFLGQF
jgi:UDP-N-acetylmuramate dehydrogenase